MESGRFLAYAEGLETNRIARKMCGQRDWMLILSISDFDRLTPEFPMWTSDFVCKSCAGACLGRVKFSSKPSIRFALSQSFQ